MVLMLDAGDDADGGVLLVFLMRDAGDDADGDV